jgi:hypothetical protein
MSESGPTLYARHFSFPVVRSIAAIQPRTPISPPLDPTITLFFTTIGAIVIVSPRLMSPIFVFHNSVPVAASTATVCPSSRL